MFRMASSINTSQQESVMIYGIINSNILFVQFFVPGNFPMTVNNTDRHIERNNIGNDKASPACLPAFDGSSGFNTPATNPTTHKNPTQNIIVQRIHKLISIPILRVFLIQAY